MITPSAATLEAGAWALAARAQYLDLEELSHDELEREAVEAHAHSADYLFSPSSASSAALAISRIRRSG